MPAADWLRRFHPADPAAVRLVCLPHAGGSASFYFPLSRALAPRLDVICVQYPGRQDRRREPLIDSVAGLADAVTPLLVADGSGPIALFGHSLGATVAFEMAQRLEHDHGIRPAHLFVSGRRAASTVRDERCHQLDDAGLLADIRRLDGTDARVDAELLELMLPAIRNDYRAAELYRWREAPALSTPITVFSGVTDPKTTPDEARAWARHTTARTDVELYPGGHFFLVEQQGSMRAVMTDRLATVTT